MDEVMGDRILVADDMMDMMEDGPYGDEVMGMDQDGMTPEDDARKSV